MASAALSIKLRCSSWEQLATLYERDLKRGAFYLKSQNPPAPGTAMRIDLTLPSGSVIVLDGHVVRIVPVGSPDGRGPGVDLVLARLPHSVLWVVESALTAASKPSAQAKPQTANVRAAPAQVSSASGGSPTLIPVEIQEEPETAEAEQDLVTALESELTALRGMNSFQVLGARYEANDDEVRIAFTDLSKKYHPDRFAQYESERARALAGEIFIVVRDAYRKIGDPTARATTRSMLRAQLARASGQDMTGLKALTQAAPVAATPSLLPSPRTTDKPSPSTPPAPAKGPSTLSFSMPPPAEGRPKSVPAPAAAPAPPRKTALGTQLDVDDLFGDMEAEGSPATAPVDLGTPSYLIDADQLLDAGRYEDAVAAFDDMARSNPGDRHARVGRQLALGFRALLHEDRATAAQHFESALEIDPMNERAARELAAMRRAATESRRGLLGKLLGRKS
jgi:hypothetical protein